MQITKIFYFYIILFSSFVYGQWTPTDQTIEALSLLTFHTQDWLDHYAPLAEEDDFVSLTSEERKTQWERTATLVYAEQGKTKECREYTFYRAYLAYQQAELFESEGLLSETKEALTQTFALLQQLREEAIDSAENDENETNKFFVPLLSSPVAELDANQVLSHSAKKKMRPYLIPEHHPLRETMDTIFKTARVTQNESSYQAAGFKTLCERPRTFVRVASHPALPGHLVKLYLDTELRKKRHKESWEWLVKRCEGAEKVRNVIRKRHIKHFVVPDKWIYPLPDHPLPPANIHYTRHLAVLLVTDMQLASSKENYYAWSHSVTEEQLDELYDIITYAKGSSYRPDNICYTKKKQYAFIDTEYPSRGPDYRSIRGYLSASKRRYWDDLIKHGRL